MKSYIVDMILSTDWNSFLRSVIFLDFFSFVFLWIMKNEYLSKILWFVFAAEKWEICNEKIDEFQRRLQNDVRFSKNDL